MRQSSSVEQTKGQLHIWTSCMVDTPRKMKIKVSLTLLHIFRKYWMLVLLRSDTLASTYCFMVTAQVTMLQKVEGTGSRKTKIQFSTRKKKARQGV